jgi:hypothetical protein
MRLVRDDAANDVEDLREPCGRRDCTAADIESARRCNAASVRAQLTLVTVGGVSPRRAKGTIIDRHQQPSRYPGPCTGSTDLLTSEDNASVIVLGDLNDEVEAATTPILNGPSCGTR